MAQTDQPVDKNVEHVEVVPADQVKPVAKPVNTTTTAPRDVAIESSDVAVPDGGCDWKDHPIRCLFEAIVDILGTLVNAIKQYATDIAEILVGSMLGLAVARFGRTIFRRVAGLISL